MQQAQTRHEHVRPQVEQYTVWVNPLSVPQRVDVYYGDGTANERRPTRYIFPPGLEVEVPSRFDQAIQRVHCEEDECRNVAPGFCTKGHPGVILGGQAPQLRRKGSEAILAEALDPAKTEKRQKQAEIAAADIARTQAQNTILIAEARRLELESEEKTKAAVVAEAMKPKPGK